MLKNNCIKLVAGLFALGAGLWAQDAKADSAADFYKGKTVNILVGFGSGGSYGVYARLLADAFARHIPGNPKVIPQFMPGGGSRKAINFLYNAAPRTGTHVGMGIPQLAFNQLIFPKGIKFDMRKFNFIGRITDGNVIFMLRSDAPGGGTLAGAMKSQVIIGGSGKGTHTYMIPAVMNSLLGTKFKIVLGYKGSRAEWLAMERNEIHGMTGSWLNWKSRKADWIKTKFITPIVEVGMKKTPGVPGVPPALPGVPLLKDLGKTKADRELLAFISSPTEIGRALLAPPGVPADRLAALRQAFRATMKDPSFLAGAKRSRLPVRPASGAVIQAAVQKALASPPALIKRAKAALGVK